MKHYRFINFIKSGHFLTWLLLMLLSVVTGGSSLMAVGDNVAPQIGDEGPDPASAAEAAANEPVEPGKSDLNSPGQKGWSGFNGLSGFIHPAQRGWHD